MSDELDPPEIAVQGFSKPFVGVPSPFSVLETTHTNRTFHSKSGVGVFHHPSHPALATPYHRNSFEIRCPRLPVGNDIAFPERVPDSRTD